MEKKDFQLLKNFYLKKLFSIIWFIAEDLIYQR